VLFTYPDPDYAERWLDLTEAERDAETARHEEWFRRYGAWVVGGADLAWPKAIRTVRKRRKGEPVITDGPFVEGKELLGGLVIVEAASFDEAMAMAAEWPSLDQGPGAGVQVEAVTEH
jgi:hypothetical protein